MHCPVSNLDNCVQWILLASLKDQQIEEEKQRNTGDKQMLGVLVTLQKQQAVMRERKGECCE